MSAKLFICRECGFETDNYKKFTSHFFRKHKLTIKDYYDKHLKISTEGICKLCGKPTKFKNFRQGYLRYCSHSCLNSAPETQEKIRKTCRIKYGVDYFSMSKEYTEKCKATNNAKYGSDYYVMTDEFKERSKNTSLEKYGVECPGQSVDAIKKREKTIMEKYGAKSYLESEEFLSKKNDYTKTILYKYDGIIFDSSWELAYYIYLKDKHINFVYHPNISFEYKEGNNIKQYHPDFLVNNKIVEIKGDHLYDKNYKYHMSDEKIECINKNADVIIKANDIVEVFTYLQENLNITISKLKRYKCT